MNFKSQDAGSTPASPSAWKRVYPSEDAEIATIEKATHETLLNETHLIPANAIGTRYIQSIAEMRWISICPMRNLRFLVVLHPLSRCAEIVVEEMQ